MKVIERDNVLLLVVSDRAQVPTRLRSPVPASIIAILFVSVNVI